MQAHRKKYGRKENILLKAMSSGNLKGSDFTRGYYEFRKLLSSSNEHEPVRGLRCGSFFELPFLYFLSNPTDVDIMYCDMTLCAIYSHVNVPARYARNVLIIDATDCHVGFVRLKNGDEHLKSHDFDRVHGPACPGKLLIQASFFMGSVAKTNYKWQDMHTLKKDNVYVLSCPLWPPEAHEWITRKRLNCWPSENIVEEIVKDGCHLVLKPHGKNSNDDTQWRYSFSQAETILIHNCWTDVQKYIYHLLRIIKRNVVIKCGGEDKTFISNYYIKTLMLWACEERPSEFWEDRNIVKSVTDLLLDLIEKLIERNVPHYFLPTNNIMDDLPCNTDAENEIRLLLGYGEEEILEILRKEQKAYHVDPVLIVLPNQSLYPLVSKFSNILYLSRNRIEDKQSQEFRTHSICSSNLFYPELEYLYQAVTTHLELSKMDKSENKICREYYVTAAEDLFHLSIQNLDYGSTRIQLHLGWSMFEIFQQLWVICGCVDDENQDPLLDSCSRGSRMASTCCYVRDTDDFLKYHCSFSPNEIKPNACILPNLRAAILTEIELPFNSTYVVCSAFRANFFLNALCNNRKALDLCNEARRQLSSLSSFQDHMFSEFLPFPLKNEWSGLYDKYIQIILGFLTLHTAVAAPSMARKILLPFYICSFQYLRYIYTRCCRILNEPLTDFGFDNAPPDRYWVSILRYQVCFSKAILRTALHVSEGDLLRTCVYNGRS